MSKKTGITATGYLAMYQYDYQYFYADNHISLNLIICFIFLLIDKFAHFYQVQIKRKSEYSK